MFMEENRTARRKRGPKIQSEKSVTTLSGEFGEGEEDEERAIEKGSMRGKSGSGEGHRGSRGR